MVDGDSTQSDKKTLRYVKVSSLLRTILNYTSVCVMAKEIGMDEKEFAQSISVARKHLAKEGIIIVNKLGYGYKVGNFNEFIIEVDKSCKRAFSQVNSMRKLIGILKASGKVDADFNMVTNVIVENVKAIDFIFDAPRYEDFESYDEFSEAFEEYIEDFKTVPDKVKETPFDLIE